MGSCSSTPNKPKSITRRAGIMQRDVLLGDKWQYDSRFNALSPKGSSVDYGVDPNLLYRFFLGTRTMWAFCDMSRKPFGLFLENQRGCQLRCTYCYADIGNEEKAKFRVSLDRIKQLHERYAFDNLNIYGGDFFYDWNFGKECLAAAGHKRIIVISTNGIGLTSERLHHLRSCCDELLLQLSIEPAHWNARVAKNGTHQNTILRDKLRETLHAAPDGVSYNVSVVGPHWLTPDNVGSMASHRQEFYDLIGSTNFSVTYKVSAAPPEDGAGDCIITDDEPEVPAWVSHLLQEEWQDIVDGNYGCLRSRQGMLAGQVGEYRRMAEAYNAVRPFSFFACSAGMGALAVGPDDRLYACHEEAVNMHDSAVIETETPRGMWARMAPTMGLIDDPVCAACPAKWHCGGICYVSGANSLCETIRAREGLGLLAAEFVIPDNVAEVAKHQVAWLDRVKAVLPDMAGFVNSPEWTDLIHGRLPAEAMVELAHDMNGANIELDKPLWEQEAMPPDVVRRAAEYDSPI